MDVLVKKKKRRWILRLGIVAIAIAAAAYMLGGPEIEPNSFLVLDVSGKYGETSPGGVLANLIKKPRLLTDLTDSLKKARHDGRIEGVIARIGSFTSGWAHAKEIRDELALVKAEGKRVVAVIEGEINGANQELYLASVADKVYIAEGASALLNGMSAQFIFLGGVWEKIDVALHVEQMREYKTIGDMLVRREMSEAHREMANWLLDDINDHYLQTLATARNLTVDEIRRLIDECPTAAARLVEVGLADGIKSYRDAVADLGDEEDPPVVTSGKYAKVTRRSLGLGDGPKLAVIHVAGTIVTGKGASGSNTVGSRTLAGALNAATEDGDIKAIVVRVESPGGSAAASDEIWRAMREAAARKPVVASLANVAASGGYYIAAGADRIVAEPNTLTGSIGVVLVKPDISGLLERLGVSTETITRGRYARLLDLTKGLDEQEIAIVRERMEDIYGLFLTRVSTGRDMSHAEVDAVGAGRVWTGAQALERGLIDELGGLHDAIRTAAAAAGINDPDRVSIVHYPKPGDITEELLQIGVRAASVATPSLPRALTARLDELAAFLELEPGIYTLMAGVPSIR